LRYARPLSRQGHSGGGPRLVHMPSEPSGSQRSPGVSSGRSFAQVAGAILRKQAPGQNPDKDEVPGSSPGRPTTHRPRSQRCRHRAGRARCRLGPRWGRMPIAAGTASGPSGAAHPSVRLDDDHAPWSRTQPEDGSHAAGAATSRGSQLPCPQRSRSDGCSARRPGLSGRSAVTRGRRLPQPGPGPPPTPYRPTRELGSVARQASSAVDRALYGVAAHRDFAPLRW